MSSERRSVADRPNPATGLHRLVAITGQTFDGLHQFRCATGTHAHQLVVLWSVTGVEGRPLKPRRELKRSRLRAVLHAPPARSHVGDSGRTERGRCHPKAKDASQIRQGAEPAATPKREADRAPPINRRYPQCEVPPAPAAQLIRLVTAQRRDRHTANEYYTALLGFLSTPMSWRNMSAAAVAYRPPLRRRGHRVGRGDRPPPDRQIQ